ncbi:MAG: septum formation initiator family protein [Armatimonadetes bacterium]|nr:septum formation initiator family protein [Armatimonadota bacterium]
MLAAKRAHLEYHSAKTISVNKQRKMARIFLLKCLACIASTCVLLIFYLTICSLSVGKQYQLIQLRESLSTLAGENETLQIELGRLSSLDRIEKIARRELGMVTPDERLIVSSQTAAWLIPNRVFARR